MLKFVVLLLCIAYAVAGTIPAGMASLDQDLDGRIIGGKPTEISKFPWQISLQRSGKHWCGGSIYSNRYIVTAAHCLYSISPSILRIRAGSSYWNSDGVVIPVSSYKIHEGYNRYTHVNDIAVIKLSSSLSYSSTIQPIDLATKAPKNGASALVSGWGALKSGAKTLPSQLQYTTVSIINRSKCASSSYGYRSAITAGMICAAATNKDSCQGDSGGPLVSGGELVGVVSWGRRCALSRYPGVYVDVPSYRSWIERAANSL